MAIDSAPYISEMDVTSPSNRDPRVEGAGQMRAIKTAIKNCFPNVGGEVTADHTRMNQVFQASLPTVGMIMMFGGTTAPEGWAFCDGKAYNNIVTPDLRNKFVVGYNPEGSGSKGDEVTGIGDEGGRNIDTNMNSYLSSGETTLSIDQIPPHTHSYTRYGWRDEGSKSGSAWDGDTIAQTGSTGGGKGHSHPLTHAKDFDVRPKWYALAYIMYVGFPST